VVPAAEDPESTPALHAESTNVRNPIQIFVAGHELGATAALSARNLDPHPPVRAFVLASDEHQVTDLVCDLTMVDGAVAVVASVIDCTKLVDVAGLEPLVQRVWLKAKTRTQSVNALGRGFRGGGRRTSVQLFAARLLLPQLLREMISLALVQALVRERKVWVAALMIPRLMLSQK
jgi:hypothetical protein